MIKVRTSPIFKAFCFFMSALTFLSCAYFAFTFFSSCGIYSVSEYLSGKTNGDVRDSDFFANVFFSDCQAARSILKNAELKYGEDEVISNATQDYLDKKASIIRNELVYAVENYGTADGKDSENAEWVTQVVEADANRDTEMTSYAQHTVEGYTIPADATDDIKAAVNALNTFYGDSLRGMLDYAYLVREDAFTENDYLYTAQINGESFSIGLENYEYDEEAAREKLCSEYEAAVSELYPTGSAELDKLVNFYYYVSYAEDTVADNSVESDKPTSSEISGAATSGESAQSVADAAANGRIYHVYTNDPLLADSVYTELTYSYDSYDNDGTLYSNMYHSDLSNFSQTASGKRTHLLLNDGYLEISGLNKEMTEFFKSAFIGEDNETIVIYLNDEFYDGDAYSLMETAYSSHSEPNAKLCLLLIAASFVASVIFFVLLISCCGWKSGLARPVTATVDKLPNDLHLVLSSGVIAGAVIAAFYITTNMTIYMRLQFYSYLSAGITTAAGLCYCVFIEFAASIARYAKSGTNWFKNTLIFMLFHMTGKAIKALSAVFSYRPKHVGRVFAAYTAAYFIVNAVLLTLAGTYFKFWIIFAFIVFNAVCLVFAFRYLKLLDIVIDAAVNRTPVEFKAKKASVPKSLRILSESLSNFNSELEIAVEKAVKDEHLRTELITNVSHDLKTPLTSLISYSDLLARCDIDDDAAKKYIAVISKQSVKLKRLIEDLIEASKASTGNITLNKTALNLTELSVQAVVEVIPETEKNENEIVFTQPDTPPIIYADSSKTFRIMSNLLSNAKKYSAPGTRIYIDVSSDENFGKFVIKNVSNEQLNISPDELTERFVRGDASRSRDGNGLGLSIAKDLCALQGGSLIIRIDADLFTASVLLPLAKTQNIPDADGSRIDPTAEKSKTDAAGNAKSERRVRTVKRKINTSEEE